MRVVLHTKQDTFSIRLWTAWLFFLSLCVSQSGWAQVHSHPHLHPMANTQIASNTQALQSDVPPAPDLRFRDMFRMPIGPAGLEPSDTLRALQGQRVRITGYMVAQENQPVGKFFLTPVPLRMSEHADGDADDLTPNTVVVFMPTAEETLPLPHTSGLLQLTGTLQYGRHTLDDGRVVWLRLILEPRPKGL